MQIGEIAPPTAGDADFLACCLGMIDDQDIGAGMGGTHHAGSARAEDEGGDGLIGHAIGSGARAAGAVLM